MRVRVLDVMSEIRASYWFVPGVMGIAGLAAAVVLLWVDSIYGQWVKDLPWVYSGDPAAARSLLSTLSGSIITVAGVLFSITIVVLSLTSNQYGSWVLLNFLRDRALQMSFGVFIGTFIYCVAVLSSFGPGDSGTPSTPRLSVTVAIAAAIFSFAILIFFIHHVASDIQADRILASIGKELLESMEGSRPEKTGRDGQPAPPPLDGGRTITSRVDGYIHGVDSDELMRLATRHDLLIGVEVQPGQFALVGSPLAVVVPPDRLDDGLVGKITQAFLMGPHQSPAQDTTFAVRQLIEAAMRALSPSLNDSYTAIASIDRLLPALCKLVVEEPPSRCRCDRQGKVRLILNPVTFVQMLDMSISPIRRSVRTDVLASIRLLEALGELATRAHRPEDLAAIASHARSLLSGAQEVLSDGPDLQKIRQRYQGVLEASRQPPPQRQKDA
ncbi:MAG: DUF2254 domain-containing protein [Planctomycetaceae bacterium]|nr:DUF2254 domain-containing protein [Planctomycetaceae bacterium]